MLRGGIRTLVGVVVLPVYLVASNCCFLGESLDRGCRPEAGAHDGCVSTVATQSNAHESAAHHSEPSSQHPSSHERPDSNQDVPCCDSIANALVPASANTVATTKSTSFVAVTPLITVTPVRLNLGVPVIFCSESPPERAGPTQHSRAPPIA